MISKLKFGLKSLLQQGISELEIYGDLVYKLKKNVSRSEFSDQFRQVTIRYTRSGYNINVMRQSACLVVGPITVNNFVPLFYTRGQVSVSKRISVLSNYFDVSFEIYYVRLKYIDSIGQVVKLLILKPASICCTFNSGHIGSHAPNVKKNGAPLLG